MAEKAESRKYFYENEHGTKGPCTAKEVKEAALRGDLQPTDTIWSLDNPKRNRASSVKNLVFASSNPNSTVGRAQVPANEDRSTFCRFPQIREIESSYFTKKLIAIYEDQLLILGKTALFNKSWYLDEDCFGASPQELVKHLDCSCESGISKENIRRIVAATIPSWIGGAFSTVLVESTSGNSVSARAWHDQVPALLEWLPDRAYVRRLGGMTFVDLFLAILMTVHRFFVHLASL